MFQFSKITCSKKAFQLKPKKASVLRLTQFCLVFLLLGNLLYSLSSLIPIDQGAKWSIFVSRGIIGFGSSIVVLVRTHVSLITPNETRT